MPASQERQQAFVCCVNDFTSFHNDQGLMLSRSSHLHTVAVQMPTFSVWSAPLVPSVTSQQSCQDAAVLRHPCNSGKPCCKAGRILSLERPRLKQRIVCIATYELHARFCCSHGEQHCSFYRAATHARCHGQHASAVLPCQPIAHQFCLRLLCSVSHEQENMRSQALDSSHASLACAYLLVSLRRNRMPKRLRDGGDAACCCPCNSCRSPCWWCRP